MDPWSYGWDTDGEAHVKLNREKDQYVRIVDTRSRITLHVVETNEETGNEAKVAEKDGNKTSEGMESEDQ